MLLISSLELTACLAVCVRDARNQMRLRVEASSRCEAPDPFGTWVNMLERQRDRRDELRYGGVERRSKISYAQLGSN